MKKVAADIKKYFGGVSPQSELGRLGEKMVKENQTILDKFVSVLNTASENAAYIENTTDEGGVRMQSRIGTTDDGRGIYRTNYEKNTPKVEKRQDIINLVQNVWSKKPISLTIVENGKERSITARFNPELSERSDLSKIAFGNRKGNASEKRITLDLSSDLYQIAEESHFVKSKDETGKADNPAHDGVKKWHYFVTNLVFEEADGTRVDCYMNIDVKENSNGDWFYSFAIEKGTAPQTLLAAVTDESATVPTNSIPDSSANSNTSDKNNLGMKQSRDADYLSAVESGDMQTAQKMVDEAAKAAGYTVETYHGTDKAFNVFNEYGIRDIKGEAAEIGFHVGSKRTAELIYSQSNELNHQVKRLYSKLGKTIRVPDVFGRWFSLYDYICYAVGDYKAIIDREALDERLKYNSDTLKADYNYHYADRDIFKKNEAYYEMLDIVDMLNEDINFGGIKHVSLDLLMDAINAQRKYLKSLDIGSIEYLNQYEDIGSISYLLLDANQVKSADPVTYDDAGNVIPLSERFNSEESDIRYDSRDGDLFSFDDDLSFGEYDDISDVITRNYTTHSEAIGEVLKNTAEIDIAPNTVKNIIGRILNQRFDGVDTHTKKELAIRLQAELESAKKGDPEKIVNRMIESALCCINM